MIKATKQPRAMSKRSCVNNFFRCGYWLKSLSLKCIATVIFCSGIISVALSWSECCDEYIIITVAVCLVTIACYFLHHHIYNFRKLPNKPFRITNDKCFRTSTRPRNEPNFDNTIHESISKLLPPEPPQRSAFRSDNDKLTYMPERTSFRTGYGLHPKSGSREVFFLEKNKDSSNYIQSPIQEAFLNIGYQTARSHIVSGYERIKHFISRLQQRVPSESKCFYNSGPAYEESFLETIQNLINDIQRPKRPARPPLDLLDN